MKKAEEENISYSEVLVKDFASITGKGIKGIVNGMTYYIGSPKLFKELLTTDFDKDLEQNVTTLQNQGKTAMIIGTEKEILGIIAVADERSEEHTSELQSRGHLVCRLLLE